MFFFFYKEDENLLAIKIFSLLLPMNETLLLIISLFKLNTGSWGWQHCLICD